MARGRVGRRRPPVRSPEPGRTRASPADADPAAKLDALFAELAQPGREDWEKIEGEITRIWSQSGSPAMDLLLSRGNEALQAEDYPTAIEHFSALIDHAPDFAEGWNARATTYYLMGEYSLSIADVEHVLVLNPRHFGALAGLAFMLESDGRARAGAEGAAPGAGAQPQPTEHQRGRHAARADDGGRRALSAGAAPEI